MISRLHVLCSALLFLPSILAAQTPAEAAQQYTTAHRPKLTQEFSEFLTIPNVAADPANLQRNAGLLVAELKKRSFESRLLSIAGAPPVVYGQITVPGAQHTIVFYAHYDGQPVTPSEWDGGSPFTPVIREVDGEPRIYARSAGDDKAAIFAQLTALDALRAAKIPLRANIRFVWEGEEEAGSPHLEQILDAIARTLGVDPLEVRRLNFYGVDSRNVTHYGQTVEDNVIHRIVGRLASDARYAERRQALTAWNAANPIIRRGLALTPVKFGISFTSTPFNQAGALVNVYTDGSVLLNHGGTEMGQGLFTKVAQVVATEFGLPLTAVRVSATDTSKVPNTSASAASASADLNGKAAQAAAETIRGRLVQFACETFGVEASTVRFSDGKVSIGDRYLSFADLVTQAYRARVSLSSTGEASVLASVRAFSASEPKT